MSTPSPFRGRWDPVRDKVRLVARPRFTEYHFGPVSAIAGQELDVQDPPDSEGKITCWAPCKNHLVFVDQRDVELNTMSQTYFGFTMANHSEESAWFHTREAAQRFSKACGWPEAEVETNGNPDPSDILDTPDKPWEKAP